MATPSRAVLWTGRVLSGLSSLVFLASAAMKLKGGEDVAQGLQQMQLPETMVRPLAFLELGCVVLYLIPRTAVLGAILLAGYLGGAILTHWRVGDAFVVPAALGVTLWLGLWLREPRLRPLLPWRTRVD